MAERMPRNNCTIEDALPETMILQINSECIGGKYKAICGQTKNRKGGGGGNGRSIERINTCKLFAQLLLL